MCGLRVRAGDSRGLRWRQGAGHELARGGSGHASYQCSRNRGLRTSGENERRRDLQCVRGLEAPRQGRCCAPGTGVRRHHLDIHLAALSAPPRRRLWSRTPGAEEAPPEMRRAKITPAASRPAGNVPRQDEQAPRDLLPRGFQSPKLHTSAPCEEEGGRSPRPKRRTVFLGSPKVRKLTTFDDLRKPSRSKRFRTMAV